MSKICSVCGIENGDEDLQCKKCGHSLKEKELNEKYMEKGSLGIPKSQPTINIEETPKNITNKKIVKISVLGLFIVALAIIFTKYI